MTIYTSRYQAEKERYLNPYYSSMDVIVKEYGGYVIMVPRDYQVWKNQKQKVGWQCYSICIEA